MLYPFYRATKVDFLAICSRFLVYIDKFLVFASQTHNMITRDAVVGGSTNFGHMEFFHVH